MTWVQVKARFQQGTGLCSRNEVKFAICNEIFEGWSLQDICEVAGRAGYTGLEVAPFTLGKPVAQLLPMDRDSIRATVENAGLQVVGLHWCLAHTTGLHITSQERSVRNQTADYLVELIHLCADIGGSVIVFGSPKQRNLPEGVSRDEASAYAVEVFQSLVPTLKSREVIFCIEPLSPLETDFINTAEEAERIISQIGSPNVALILDVKAMSSENQPIAGIIRDHAHSIAHFHANDANLRGPGFGNTDFMPIAAALREIDYTGWVSVEVFDFTPDPITIANRSMGYLKSVFDANRSLP